MMSHAKTIFLWGGEEPPPNIDAFNPRDDKWWNQYSTSLKLSSSALRELSRTSREIVGLLPDPLNWDHAPKPYRGLVVGAVQSGKTASMMGVAAIALDQGFRMIIVLAGSKDDLRQQTARRFNTQLMQQSDPIPDADGATTLGSVKGPGPLGGFAPPFSLDANQFSLLHVRMAAALRKGQPCVAVIKKNVASLRDIHSSLQTLYKTFGIDALPTLVLDDECDDASVDSTDTTIPFAIANLWRRPGADVPLVAYVGYTATAAANVLQATENELYPKDMAYLLRFAGEHDTPIEFTEANPDLWYSGGECFYQSFGDEPGEAGNFLIRATVAPEHLVIPPEHNPSLKDALRGYFVSGAYRLAIDPTRRFVNGDKYPRPHTMLVQTSPDTNEHTRWAKGIAQILGGTELQDRTVGFDAKSLIAEVDREEGAWKEWFDWFDGSRERVYEERPHQGVHKPVTWDQVRENLQDVFEHTRLKVVNSDPTVGSALDFSPRELPDGRIHPPLDIYTIVIGGAKLSRGLTLEGLCISYFVRWSNLPTEDTVLQLSRWFGYRGTYLEFCRVFTTAAIAENLRLMHENDTDLRLQLAELMAKRMSPLDARLVIRSNPRALPTGKMGMGEVVDLAFSPFVGAFKNVETELLAQHNENAALSLVQQIRARGGLKVVTAGGSIRGVLSRGWSMIEIANTLESFQFTRHNPDKKAEPLREFHRDADLHRQVLRSFRHEEDLYRVAAYLRAWEENAKGNGTAIPNFNVGFSFGELATDAAPFDFPLVNRQISDADRVIGGWTGSSSNWRGDAFFDDPADDLCVQGSQQRLEGAEGLLLLYVVHKSALGRSGGGKPRECHTPFLAISIPAGGPRFRRVLV